MVITDFSRAYLVLNKLTKPDREVFSKNVNSLQSFWLTPEAVLIVPTENISPLMKAVTAGLNEPGKVTFIEVGKQIYTTLRTPGVCNVDTVFDK